MKISWGTGILLAILAFSGFIMYFFVITLVDKKYDHELVTENYYAQELDFQKNIDAEKATLEAHMQVDLSYREGAKEGIRLDFPTVVTGKEVIGVIFCYRPSDSKLDFTLPITTLDGCSLVIPDNLLKAGRWNIRVEYAFEGKNYLSLSDKVNY
ncbi:MAG: nitrogen fixation protein FixH [Capnocytophaga sp.]|uniref:FixH family protein n=1 Tax=Capnocytophaga sp. oral taxon 863 TaxID=1227265 RepID=UPI00041DBC29|nr:FixH family protein [Capnocytophaga sp. oral taxon 863]RKW07711.1 MAG: nitrogen fixation protein FixH [Capnocytophaga sp.]